MTESVNLAASVYAFTLFLTYTIAAYGLYKISQSAYRAFKKTGSLYLLLSYLTVLVVFLAGSFFVFGTGSNPYTQETCEKPSAAVQTTKTHKREERAYPIY